MTIYGTGRTASSLNEVHGHMNWRGQNTKGVPQNYYLLNFAATSLLHLVADTDETAQKLHGPSYHTPPSISTPICRDAMGFFFLPEIAPQKET